MISILVYGRNDERGYGMHKRVALSLNALASVIDKGTSEIIFVDYNTPDHLPTLPELIRDTLTETARRRLRVLRVRSAIHARFADQTTLPVLEPVARNIALRRTRPQNQWVLSTNTDCIVVPSGGRSLVDVVSGLQGRSYGLPRFELPERVWETFDRRDAKATISAAAEWGRAGRLDESVSGEGVVLFDGPGDFQLVRRADLFAIDGFDEEMVLGWHVDHNLAQRLHLKVGAAASLLGQASLYHCGHARAATQTHGHDRVENDVARFVNSVTVADLPHQRDSWGCPDDLIEEVDLTAEPGARLKAAVSAAVTPLNGKSLAAAYDASSFDNFFYDAGHVATHVLDLVSSYPRDTAFAYVGVRRDLLAALLKGLPALGFTYKVMVPDVLGERLATSRSTEVQVVPLDDALEAADVLLFEFGLIRDEAGATRDVQSAAQPNEAEAAALETVSAAYRKLVAMERSAQAFGHAGRMVVAINAIHNRFEPAVAATLRATPSPFSTRLRFGAVIDRDGGNRETLGLEMAKALGRSKPVPHDEIGAARALLRQLVETEGVSEGSRLEIAASMPLVAALLGSERIGGRLGEKRGLALQRLAEYGAPVEELAHIEPAPPVAKNGRGAEAPVSGLAHLADFSDPAWLLEARQISSGGARGSVRRNGWVWERAQLMRALASAQPRRAPRALVLVERSDRVIGALAARFENIDIADVQPLFGKEAAQKRYPSQFADGEFLGGATYRVVTAEQALAEKYDAIILPHSSGFLMGVMGLGRLVARLRKALKPNGLLVFACEVALLGQGRVGRPTVDAALTKIPAVLAEHAGLTLVGAPGGLNREDLPLVGVQKDLEDGRPVLGIRRDNDVFWPSLWFYRADVDRGLALERLGSAFADLSLGDQMPALQVSERGRRTQYTIIGDPGRGEGHVFYGPFVVLPPSSYEASIKLARVAPAASARSPVRLVLEASVGPKIVVQSDVPISGRKATGELKIHLPFEVKPEDATQPCEIRLWSDGQAEIVVSEVELRRTGA